MPSLITLCGSLSELPGPLGRSLHEAGYAALSLPFAYVPFKVRDLRGAITGMRALGIRGFGVSHPFKDAVIPLLDSVDDVAEQIGAVNTIVNDDGVLKGHNTDWIGAVRALEEKCTLKGARVLLLGTGGAARAIAFGLAQRGACTTIAGRDSGRAERLARSAGAVSAAWSEVSRASDYDVLVHATPIGQADQAGPKSPLPEGASLRRGQVVMDIVYKPVATALLAFARQSGAVTIHGGRMLLFQAMAQFELYTGVAAPVSAMRRALEESVGSESA